VNDLDPELIARVQELLAADAGPEPSVPDAPAPVVPEIAANPTPPPPKKRSRAKLYDPKRRGYMRATREQNLSPPESPFFDETPPTEEKPSGAESATERLRQLGLTSAKK
jgi:hypothetical protein